MAEEALLVQRVRDGLLLNVYGTLLTEKQRLVCEMVLLQDLSLAEAAESLGISRQGIHDMVTRSKERMEKTEKCLGLLKKEAARKEIAELLETHRTELPRELYDRFAELLDI